MLTRRYAAMPLPIQISSTGAVAIPFPPSVLPDVVAWLDGNQPQYSDASGTTPATGDRAAVRRVNEPAPLAGNWQSIDDAHRPGHDTAGIRSEIAAPTYLVRSAAPNLAFQNSTIVISFVTRGNPFSMAQGLLALPNAGSGSHYGLTLYQGGNLALYNSTVYVTAVPVDLAVRTTYVVQFGAGNVKIKKIAGTGTVTDYVEAAGFGNITTGASIPQLFAALIGGGFYGSASQVLLIRRVLTDDTEATAIGAWAHAQVCPEAYPTDGPLLVALSDSITANAGNCPMRTLAGLRPTNPKLEVCNLAVAGSFTSSMLQDGVPFVGPQSQAQFARASQYWSASRARNILLIASGTNDLANAVPPSTARDQILSVVDQAAAIGWQRKLVAGILHRYFPGNPTLQTTFNAARSTLNSALASFAASHGYTYIDVSSLEAYAMSDPTYSGDGTHPNDAFYVHMNDVYQPVIAAAAA